MRQDLPPTFRPYAKSINHHTELLRDMTRLMSVRERKAFFEGLLLPSALATAFHEQCLSCDPDADLDTCTSLTLSLTVLAAQPLL